MSAIDNKVPFEKVPEKSFLVTATGEAIYDNINVGKLPDDWHALDISKLVEPGFVWRARLDYLSKYGSKVLTALVLASGLSIMVAGFGVGLLNSKGGAATPPSFVEKLITAPWTFVTGNYPAAVPSEKSDRPVLDFGQVRWQPKVGLGPADAGSDWVTKANDLEALVKMELAALEKTGKLDPKIATTPMADVRETWSSPATEKEVPASVDANGMPTLAQKVMEGGKPDTLRVVDAGDSIFVFSVVLVTAENSPNRTWTPWAGVLHKGSAGWEYKNFSVPGVGSYQIKAFGSVSANDIPHAVAKAFPLLVRTPQVVQK